MTILVLLVACGQPPSKKTTAETISITALEGSWQSGCQVDMSPAALSEYVDTFYAFKNNSYIKIQKGYSAPKEKQDAPCAEQPTYELKEFGQFTLEKSSNILQDELVWKSGDWGLINFKPYRHNLTPRTARVTNEWNAGSLCQVETWKLGVPSRVTNKSCFGVRLFKTQTLLDAVKYEQEDGEIFATFGAFLKQTRTNQFDDTRRFKKLPYSTVDLSDSTGDQFVIAK